jgi:hypothetical protein
VGLIHQAVRGHQGKATPEQVVAATALVAVAVARVVLEQTLMADHPV